MNLAQAHLRKVSWPLAVLLIAASATFSWAQTEDTPPVKKKLAADVRAYRAARILNDPEQRLTAMRAFVHDNPKSQYFGSGQDVIFKTLLENFPQRTADIDAQIKLELKSAGKGQGRASEETYIAFTLANAGPSGVELRLAEKLAQDAVKRISEPEFNADTVRQYAKYKVPPPKAPELHAQFARSRAGALAVLAEVYLREGKQAQAASLEADAYALDPMVDDVNSARGRLALLDHKDAEALNDFERGQLLGALTPADRSKMLELYRAAHNGSDAGLDDEMDASYAQLYPHPSTVNPPKPVISGRTVLLELFTGSGCEPCVGGDLAVDGLLENYPRGEIVALSFDLHIPEPDPLTNPDSVARADFYEVAHTPTYLIDGKQQSLGGSGREGSHDLYATLAKAVDAEAALPSGIDLRLSASQSPEGEVKAQAVVTLPGNAEILKALAAEPKPAPDPADDPAAAAKSSSATKQPAPAKAATPVPEAPAEPRLVVNFALVEDDVRYSGENGIRFHRMVVRALSKPAYTGFHIEPGSTHTLEASFDPAAISASLVAYLNKYEQQNDKFGKINFLTKNMTMRPNHLAVAAWVQNSVTHRVLQAAIFPLGSESKDQKGAE